MIRTLITPHTAKKPLRKSHSCVNSMAFFSNKVEVKDNFLRFHFDKQVNGIKHADYHYFWLRHNCDCKPLCRHLKTNERIIDSSEIPLNITPLEAKLNNDSLEIEWLETDPKATGKKHKSVYSADWLAKYAYATNREDVQPPSNDVSRIEIDYSKLSESAKGSGQHAGELLVKEMGDRLFKYGGVVVRKYGMDTEQIVQQLNAKVIETHFGRIEDLRTDNTTNKNNDQLGYTDAAVNLHTDQPFIENPPGMQLLHCMQRADTGGENWIVDAFQAAAYLKATDASAYEMLTTFPIRFHRKQSNFASLKISPIFELKDGRIVKVRYSYFTMDPHNASFDKMEEWYRAYNKFASLIREPKHQYRALLNPGDFLMYDNFRMLHARTSFTGARWLRGVYFDHQDVWKTLNISCPY